MTRVADYIIERLNKIYGVKHIFMISGGGAMHLNDAVGKCKDIEYICNHHEQASAIGAEGYARASGKLAVVNVTTGPGGTNAITGVLGQWTDSIPVLYISGQVKYETTIASCLELGLRQLGDQEVDIVSIVKPITKYAKMIINPLEIKKELDKAIRLATSGRPGPVWLDIPLNIQGALIDESKLYEYEEEKEVKIEGIDINGIIKLLEEAERPVIVAGHGVRLSGSQKELFDFARKISIPILTTFNGVDLIENDNELFIGRIGTLGSRAGNFSLQNADLLISLGSRNNIRQISYNWPMYARSAKKIIVDIDESELKKATVKPDITVKSDVKTFVMLLSDKLRNVSLDFGDWLNWCKIRKEKYPIVLKEHLGSSKINPYVFINKFTQMVGEEATIVAGNGTACVAAFQAGVIKKNTRMFWNSGCASMGYDIPAAIGACYGKDKKEVYCIAGDGSSMMNIQELMTIAHNNIPVKIIILNNDGYISIKQTQEAFFESRYVASGKKSGVGMPDFCKVGEAFGIKTIKIAEYGEMEEKIKEVIEYKGAVLCEVLLDTDYKFMPKLSSKKLEDGRMVSKPLEDLYPFLSIEEMCENMIVPLIDEK